MSDQHFRDKGHKLLPYMELKFRVSCHKPLFLGVSSSSEEQHRNLYLLIYMHPSMDEARIFFNEGIILKQQTKIKKFNNLLNTTYIYSARVQHIFTTVVNGQLLLM